MQRKWSVAMGLLLAIVCASRTSAAAENGNLVPNGSFDTDLSGWRASAGISAIWSSDDADGAADSGSATLNLTLQGEPRLTSTCIPVVGGSNYLFAVARKRQASPALAVSVRLSWWLDDACETRVGDELVDGGISEDWTTTSLSVVAPADAAWARIRIGLRRPMDVTRFYPASIDNVVLAPDACGGTCGDPVTGTPPLSTSAPALITPSDALYILQVATELDGAACPPCICDVDSSGDVGATDALLTLAAAAGAPVSLTCPD